MGYRAYLTVSRLGGDSSQHDRGVCFGNYDCCLLGLLAAAAADDSEITVEQPSLKTALDVVRKGRARRVPYGHLTFEAEISATRVLALLQRYKIGVLSILASDIIALESAAAVSRHILLREIDVLCSEVALDRKNSDSYRPTLEELRQLITDASEEAPRVLPRVKIDFSETAQLWSTVIAGDQLAKDESSWLPLVLLTRLAADRIRAVENQDFARLHANTSLVRLFKPCFGDTNDDEAALEWCLESGRSHDRGSVANALVKERYADRQLVMASLLSGEPLDGGSWIYHGDWPAADDPTFFDAVRLNREAAVKSEGAEAFRLRTDHGH